MKHVGISTPARGTEEPPRFLTALDFLLKLPLFIRLPSAAERERRGQNDAVRYTPLLTSQPPKII